MRSPFWPLLAMIFGTMLVFSRLDLRGEIEKLRQTTATLAKQNGALLRDRALRRPSKRYDQDNRNLGAPKPAERRAILIGDSVVESWPAEFLPDKTGFRLVNRGIGGETTEMILARFPSDVLALAPDAVVLMGGLNDLRAGGDEALVFARIIAMAELASQANIRVLIGALTPAAAEDEINRRITAVNRALRRYCARRGCLFVDYHHALSGSQGQPSSEKFLDALHPNAAGYAAMSRTLRDALRLSSSPKP